MSQQDIEDSMETTKLDSENSLTDRLVLELAAHPLSSCNPPPRELPDLLDSLIASESRLEGQVTVIDKLAIGLSRRIEDLRKRLQKLRAENLHFKTNTNTMNLATDSESVNKRRIFEAQERVLQRMCLQIAFIHHTFVQKIRVMTISIIKAHRDIFDEFLGEKHNHAGIQIANSSTLSCTPDCDWYQEHGPFEWSKKPYSNGWWKEMNHTDWDWLRMKEHFAETVTTSGGRIIAMFEMLQGNSMKFVPSWFWADDFETWTLHGRVESVKNTEGRVERQVVIKVRFNKTPAMIEHETVKKLNELKKTQAEQQKAGASDTSQPTDGITIEIGKVGEMIIDETFAFNGLASKPGLDGQGPQRIRWLVWWGFEKWYAEHFSKRVPKTKATNGQQPVT